MIQERRWQQPKSADGRCIAESPVDDSKKEKAAVQVELPEEFELFNEEIGHWPMRLSR